MHTRSLILVAALAACSTSAESGRSSNPGARSSVLLAMGTPTTPPGGTGATGDTGGPASPPMAIQTVDGDGNPITIDAAIAVIRHIELDLPDGERCSDLQQTFTFTAPVRCASGEDKISIVGPFVVDLVTGASTPSLSGLTLPALAYRRVDVRLDDSHAPDRVTLTLAGTAELPSQIVSFEARLSVSEDARFESPAGIAVDATTPLVAMIDADVVLGRTRLGACAATLARDGHAIIDPESDCGDDLEDTIEDALKESFDLD